MHQITDPRKSVRSSTADSFKFVMPLSLPGFSFSGDVYGGLDFRSQLDEAFGTQYLTFRVRLLAAIGRRYLPIYRMADGEFAFMVGDHRRTPDARSLLSHMAHRIRNRIHGGTQRTCWGEEYFAAELHRGKEIFRSSLRKIASEGILATYFAVRPDRWAEGYFSPVCSWLEVNQIYLTPDNYVPFYFIYAVLNDPHRAEVYRGRRVLVVTYLTPERKRGLTQSLLREGARSVTFLEISRTKALLDEVNVSGIPGTVDLALVAGGIGAVNILSQLETLGVPCIDCGICVDCLLDDRHRLERPFLIGDDRRPRQD